MISARIWLWALALLLLHFTPVAHASSIFSQTDKFGPVTTGEGFGETVSLSGNYMIGGASGEDSAYIYSRGVSGWQQVDRLDDSDTTRNLFGYSVSISGDFAVVSAPWTNSSRGAAHVFQRNGGQWTNHAILTASDGDRDDWFGESVSIDGTRIVIGAARDRENYGNGSVYVFDYDGQSWSQTAKLAPFSSPGEIIGFGKSVAVEGDQILIGSSSEETSDGIRFGGAAYFYSLTNGSWNGQSRFERPNLLERDFMGYSVSLSGDLGVVATTGQGVGQASVEVYRKIGQDWIAETSLIPDPNSVLTTNLHKMVAVEGETIVLGSSLSDSHGNNSGAAYVYQYSNGQWNASGQAIPIDISSRDEFGLSVDIDGSTILVGSYNDDGSVYEFTIPEPTSIGLMLLGCGTVMRRQG